MQIIKEEYYKGRTIVVEGEFMEGTRILAFTKVYYDTVNLEMRVQDYQGVTYYHRSQSVEENRDNRNGMYKQVVESIGRLIETAKELIDKEIREQDITDGLPESLLVETKNEEDQKESYSGSFDAASGTFSGEITNMNVILEPEKVKEVLNGQWNDLVDKLESTDNNLFDTIYGIVQVAIKEHENRKQNDVVLNITVNNVESLDAQEISEILTKKLKEIN